MSYFALDIGSYAIKFVKADGHGSHTKIKTIGSVYNSLGQILPSDPHQLEQLAVLIKNGVKEFGLGGQNVHLSLPASQAYMSIVAMPVLTDNELASAITWEAEQHIPVNLTELNFEYDVISRPEGNAAVDSQMSVFMVGAPKAVVNRYIELLELAGLEPIGLEPDIVSLVRSFIPKTKDAAASLPQGASLYCNFGALSTNFVVIKDGLLQATHVAPIGSLALTRSLEKTLGLDPSRSEEYKRTYGLAEDQLEGKVRVAMLPVVDSLIQEFRKTIQYYISKSPANEVVSRIVISGGGANLPGLAAYVANVLSTEVIIGDPFALVEKDPKTTLPEDVASYCVASGLATKEF